MSRKDADIKFYLSRKILDKPGHPRDSDIDSQL